MLADKPEYLIKFIFKLKMWVFYYFKMPTKTPTTLKLALLGFKWEHFVKMWIMKYWLKNRSNQQQEKIYDTSDYYTMLASQDFHWTDYTKKVHKFKPCSVRMKRLKVRNNLKKKVFTITPTNVPTFYLPLFLNNFDLLDCQGPAEKCIATKSYGLANIYFSYNKLYGS